MYIWFEFMFGNKQIQPHLDPVRHYLFSIIYSDISRYGCWMLECLATECLGDQVPSDQVPSDQVPSD